MRIGIVSKRILALFKPAWVCVCFWFLMFDFLQFSVEFLTTFSFGSTLAQKLIFLLGLVHIQ